MPQMPPTTKGTKQRRQEDRGKTSTSELKATGTVIATASNIKSDTQINNLETSRTTNGTGNKTFHNKMTNYLNVQREWPTWPASGGAFSYDHTAIITYETPVTSGLGLMDR